MVTKQELRAMMKELNKTLQSNPLKTDEDHKDFKEVHIRLNDLKELFYQ